MIAYYSSMDQARVTRFKLRPMTGQVDVHKLNPDNVQDPHQGFWDRLKENLHDSGLSSTIIVTGIGFKNCIPLEYHNSL